MITILVHEARSQETLFCFVQANIDDLKLDHPPHFLWYPCDAVECLILTLKCPLTPPGANQVDCEKRSFRSFVSVGSKTEMSGFDEDAVEEGSLSRIHRRVCRFGEL